MQIKFIRSGGLAGAATRVAGTVEFHEHSARVQGEATDYQRDLAPEEAEQLRSAADPGALAGAKAAGPFPGPVRDGYQYDVTVVTEDGKSHSVTLGEGRSAPLAVWVQQEAQKIWRHRSSTHK